MTQTYTDDFLKSILSSTRVIALVGYSANPDRPSHKVAKFLKEKGFRVIPVNPGLAGQQFYGEPIMADLASIPADAQVDMVDVFRRSEQVPGVVEAALAALPALKTVWLQLGITSAEAEAATAAKGLNFVENRCPAIEYPRLF